MLLRSKGLGEGEGIKESDIYICIWSSEDVHACK